MKFRKDRPEPEPGLYLTGINIYITLVLNGIEPETAWERALQFSGSWGWKPTPMPKSDADELATWLTQTIQDLTETSQVERAAALVTIEELTEERNSAEAAEVDAWKQVEEQERTIEELQRRITELAKDRAALYDDVQEQTSRIEALERLPLPEPDEGSWNASAGR